MRFPWSFLRPFPQVAIIWLLIACGYCVLLGQATGDDGQAVHDWDIRSLYRVRFQHITKRPPNPVHPRMVDRRSKLATRWAALKDRIAEFFPSRHTNPRTVITFDRLATDFVNVGIVKLAKVLDPPKPPKRDGKGKADSTVEPPTGTDADAETVALPDTTTKATPDDARPKRRVTLVMDLPDFLGVQEDSAEEQYEEEDPNDLVIVKQSKLKRRTPGLPATPMKLICEEPCAASVAMADHGPPRTLITLTLAVPLLLCSAFLRM
uniref:Putative secreted protein n=1 Tax=Anopheles darlingi TaxID=43151 RepID=A0A2M4DHX8_ANODA